MKHKHRGLGERQKGTFEVVLMQDEDGRGLTDEEIQSEADTFMFAGDTCFFFGAIRPVDLTSNIVAFPSRRPRHNSQRDLLDALQFGAPLPLPGPVPTGGDGSHARTRWRGDTVVREARQLNHNRPPLVAVYRNKKKKRS